MPATMLTSLSIFGMEEQARFAICAGLDLSS